MWIHRYKKTGWEEFTCHEDPNREGQWWGGGGGTTIFTVFYYFSTSESWNLNYLSTYPLPHFISAVSQFIVSTKIPKAEKQSPFIIVSIKWKWSRSVMSNSATPWTVAHQAPPSTEFFRQQYCSGFSLPSPGIFLTRDPTQSPHCGQRLYRLSHQVSPN